MISRLLAAIDARDVLALLGWLMIVAGGCLLAAWVGLVAGGALLFWTAQSAARAAARGVTDGNPR